MTGAILTVVPNIASTVVQTSSAQFTNLLDKPELWSGFVGVLIGGLISGIFNYATVRSNNRTSLSIKEKEIAASRAQFKLQSDSSKQLKDIELKHQKTMQKAQQNGQKELRFLDEKIKIFSEFNKAYMGIFLGVAPQSRVENCRNLRSALTNLELFAPDLTKEIGDLVIEVVKFSNYWKEVVRDSKKSSLDKTDEFLDKIRPLGNKIGESLPSRLINNA